MRFSISSAFQDFSEVVALAKAADEIGYHGLALSDHVINLEVLETAYPYTSDGSRRWEPFTPWLDPWVTVGALATVTEKLQFFTSVYVLPMRNPLLVAKAVGTAAVISNNRVQLGIGTGWCEEEFDLLEQPFARRGKRNARRCRADLFGNVRQNLRLARGLGVGNLLGRVFINRVIVRLVTGQKVEDR